MRNGNTETLEKIGEVMMSSYPTYEEWKLFSVDSDKSLESSSYPTYEEWKQK